MKDYTIKDDDILFSITPPELYIDRLNNALHNQTTVEHPSHYTKGKLEVIEAIEGLNLSYHLGNVVKYLARHKFKNTDKDKQLEDLLKAQWYLNRYIENFKKES